MEKVMFTHMGDVTVDVISKSFGSYVVYTLGDGTQPDPRCEMAETCTLSSCTDDVFQDGFPYPVVRHINFKGNETKVGNSILCDDENDEPTRGKIILTAEDYHSFAAIACRSGNEASTVVAKHVQVMEQMYYWVGLFAFYMALLFACYYVNKVCQFYTWIKICDIKFNNGRCLARLSKVEKVEQFVKMKTRMSSRNLSEGEGRSSEEMDLGAFTAMLDKGGLATTGEPENAGE